MFDDRLKLLREEKELNKKDAANKLNMAYTTYLGYEKNEREPNSDVLIKIANFFDVDVDYLLGISPCKKKENYILVEDLGLSEKSIDCIKKLNTNAFSVALNDLIESKDFYKFIQIYEQYKSEFKTSDTATDAFNEFCSKVGQYGKDFYAVENVKDYEHLIYDNLQRCLESIVQRLKL